MDLLELVDGGVDLCHNQPLKALHDYRIATGWWSLWHEALECLVTGMIVVILKHVGITDWDKETLVRVGNNI